MKLFGKKEGTRCCDICGDETDGYQGDAPVQKDISLADIIPEVASSPAAAKAVSDILEISHWTCTSCQQVNSGTVTCSRCGEPLSDEGLLVPLRTIAALTAAEECA